MNCLEALNKAAQGFQKLAVLEVQKKYKVEKVSKIKTKFGVSLIVTLEEVGDIIMPSRFRNLVDKIDEMNEAIEEKPIYLERGEAVEKFIPVEFKE